MHVHALSSRLLLVEPVDTDRCGLELGGARLGVDRVDREDVGIHDVGEVDAHKGDARPQRAVVAHRRFERAAVLALRSAGTPGRSDLPPAPVLLEGAPVPLHSHISSYYTSNRGRLRLGLPFLRDGILGGQNSILFANPETAAEIEAELRREAIDLADAGRRGVWLRLEPFSDVEKGLATFEETFAAITRRGGLAIRLLGEAMQNRDRLGSLTDLLRFEAGVHSLVRRFPVVILCQYDARLLKGEELVAVLKTHADNFDRSMGIYLN